jgi:hypothetical protein
MVEQRRCVGLRYVRHSTTNASHALRTCTPDFSDGRLCGLSIDLHVNLHAWAVALGLHSTTIKQRCGCCDPCTGVEGGVAHDVDELPDGDWKQRLGVNDGEPLDLVQDRGVDEVPRASLVGRAVASERSGLRRVATGEDELTREFAL